MHEALSALHCTSSQLAGSDLGPGWTSSSAVKKMAGQSKMDPKSEFQKKFHEEIALLRNADAFKFSTASLQDLLLRGYGDLAEGIRTTMKIGDLELFGAPEESPDESSVIADYEHFYNGKEMAQMSSLLPALTVIGTEETKPGGWRMLFESEKSRLWALLRMLAKLKQAALVGNESEAARCDKIVTDLLEALPVVIVKMKKEDELWAEWARSQATSHTDLGHSTDRITVRFTFFSKLKESLKQALKDAGKPAEVTVKQLFEAYIAAEEQKKFSTARGMTGVKRDNELSSLMKWGDFIAKIGGMDAWKALEVLADGKTSFFTPLFGSSFCGLVDNDEDIAKYVLSTLTAKCGLAGHGEEAVDEKWQKRVIEANVTRTKSIVKTLVLQWKWAKGIFDSSKSRPIMSEEKQTRDFETIETAFSMTEALQVMADSTGIKASLHPLSLELWTTCFKVLCEQAHFNVFQGAEAMNKSFQNTIQVDALQALCVANISNPWKDAHAQFAGHGKKDAAQNEETEEDTKALQASHTRLPTRKEAVKVAAKNELQLYTGTSFAKTGDVTQDRLKMFQSEIAKKKTAQTAQWNTETQGNRRGTLYDEKCRRNPKWAYVNGRNPFRGRVSFQKDDFEALADFWAIMAKPGEGPMKDNIDVLMVWNAEQDKASAVIMKKMKSLLGVDGQVKKTLLKGLQAHVERRLWDGAPEGAVGELAGLPGMQEELFEVFAGPLPSRRKHILPMGGITDNMYPEEIVPLRNPKQSEPLVSEEVKKAIFPPDDDKPHDGEMVVRSDEVWAPCHVCSCLSKCVLLF